MRLTDRDFCRNDLGHGNFALDLDDKAHAFDTLIAETLRQRLLLYLDGDGVWRLRTHGFPDLRGSSKLGNIAVCDFCGERPVTWDIPCTTFEMPDMSVAGMGAPPGMSDGDWAACETCGEHITNGRRDALLRHCQQYHDDPNNPPPVRRMLKKFQAELHTRFWKHYKGGAILYTAPTPTPAFRRDPSMPIDHLCATAREMQTVALRTAQQVLTQVPTRDQQIDQELVAYLPGADCFAWTTETTAAVWAIAPQVQDETPITEDLLPEGSFRCFWWFDWPLPSPDQFIHTDLSVDRDNTHGLFLVSAPDGLGVYRLRRVHPYGLIAPTRFVIPWNVTIGSLRTRPMTSWQQNEIKQGRLHPLDDAAITILRFIVAACVWLHQKVATTSERALERHQRKRIMREEQLDFAPTVHVVELRRAESSGTTTGEHHAPNWHWQWIVSGHIRNQPTKHGVRPIWIHPYTKGPKDKPLKLPTEKVYRVDR